MLLQGTIDPVSLSHVMPTSVIEACLPGANNLPFHSSWDRTCVPQQCICSAQAAWCLNGPWCAQGGLDTSRLDTAYPISFLLQPQAVVTAWEVSGKVDYNKLCEEFGCTPIPTSLVDRIEKVTGVPAHPFLKRQVFYAHRDLEQLLDLYEKGEKFYLYTGVTPNQPLRSAVPLVTIPLLNFVSQLLPCRFCFDAWRKCTAHMRARLLCGSIP